MMALSGASHSLKQKPLRSVLDDLVSCTLALDAVSWGMAMKTVSSCLILRQQKIILTELVWGRLNLAIGSNASFGNENYFIQSLFCLDMKEMRAE